MLLQCDWYRDRLRVGGRLSFKIQKVLQKIPNCRVRYQTPSYCRHAFRKYSIQIKHENAENERN